MPPANHGLRNAPPEVTWVGARHDPRREAADAARLVSEDLVREGIEASVMTRHGRRPVANHVTMVIRLRSVAYRSEESVARVQRVVWAYGERAAGGPGIRSHPFDSVIITEVGRLAFLLWPPCTCPSCRLSAASCDAAAACTGTRTAWDLVADPAV